MIDEENQTENFIEENDNLSDKDILDKLYDEKSNFKTIQNVLTSRIFLKYLDSLINMKNKVTSIKLDQLVENINCFRHSTSFLFKIRQDLEYEEVIKHPVITIYLLIQWKKFLIFWLVELFLYCLYCGLLIFYCYSNIPEVLFSLILLVCVILLCYEGLKLISWFTRYWVSLENYFNILLLLPMQILIYSTFDTDQKRKTHITVLTLSLVSFKFFFIFGRTTFFSKNIFVYKRVFLSFLKCSIPYILIIIGFALFCKSEDISETHFDTFWSSIFNTLVTFVGEININDLYFREPYIQVVFVLLLLCVPVLLNNVVIGFVVNDMLKVEEDAKLLENLERALDIFYIENILLMFSLPCMKKMLRTTLKVKTYEAKKNLSYFQKVRLVLYTLFDYSKFYIELGPENGSKTITLHNKLMRTIDQVVLKQTKITEEKKEKEDLIKSVFEFMKNRENNVGTYVSTCYMNLNNDN